jgi:hypothetical protein
LSPRHLISGTTFLAVASIVLLLSLGRRMYLDAGLEARLRHQQVRLTNQGIRDRLIGSKLRLDGLQAASVTVSGQPGQETTSVGVALPSSGYLLLLVVSPARCLGCIRSLAYWNTLAKSPAISTAVLLTGVEPSEGRRIRARLSMAGSFFTTPATLPANLSAVRLLVDSMGVVVMADTRSAECEWSFEAAVARILRLPGHYLVRPSGTSTLVALLAR